MRRAWSPPPWESSSASPVSGLSPTCGGTPGAHGSPSSAPSTAARSRYEVPGPLVVGLQQAWNDPRTAKLPNILKSRRAPIEKIGWSDTSAALGPLGTPAYDAERFQLPPARTGARMIGYKTPAEAAEKLVRILREDAKVFP